MGDAENALQPSKKRAAGREISRDNPGLDDDEETGEQETGTFKRASDEVMASRRIVKVRRQQTSTQSAPSNPFAGIRLVPPPDMGTKTVIPADAEPGKTVEEKVEDTEKEADVCHKQSESKVDELKVKLTVDEEKPDNVTEPGETESANEVASQSENTADEANKDAEVDRSETETRKDAGEETENEEKKDVNTENVGKSAETSSFGSFQQLSSSQNAFTGLAGTGFSSSTFSVGTTSNDSSLLGSGSLFGVKTEQSSFTFGLPTNGSISLFGSSGLSVVGKNEGSGFPSMPEVPVETGEENEKPVFTADSVLFEFLEGGWKERGKGEVKVNVPTAGTGKARLIMRTRGNYRLILNANLFPDMKLTNMDKRGITFACINSAGEGKSGLSTFALKFKDASFVEEFREAVLEHKGNIAVPLKTPENSPKASED